MPHTVLSVDDDAAAGDARNQVLREAGFEVIEAATGADALKLASEKQPAVVVLAIGLRGMDGFDVCRRLKADPRAASIPVLHISSHGESHRDYPESIESGADAYLREPLDPPVLVAVAKALIRARSGGAGKAAGDAPSNGRLLALIDSIPDEVWFADAQGRFTLANPSALREFNMGASGLPDVEGMARRLEVYRVDGSPRPVEEAPPLRALRGETVRDQEELVRTPVHGELRYRQISASPVLDAAGHIAGSVSVVRDITGRKRAEEERQRLAGELADRAGELQAILDAAPVAIWIAHDPQCLRITGNAVADQVVMQAERGGNVSASARPGDAAVSYKVFRNGVGLRPEELPNQIAAATGQPVKEEEYEMVFPDGRTVQMLLGAVPLFDAEGRVRGSVAAGANVTRRKQAEEALRESEAVLRSFFDSPGVLRGFVELVDGSIVHVSCNSAAAEMFGVERESIAGKSATEAGAPEEIARAWVGLYDESRRTGKPVSMEYARQGRDGQDRWLLATACYLGAGPSGDPRFAYTILDLTDRKRAEDALRQSEERYRMMFGTMLEGFCIIEVIFDADSKPVDYRFLEVNPAFEAQTGLKNAQGRLMRELAPEHEAHWFEIYGQVALTGQPARFVNEARALDRWYDVSAYRVGGPESRKIAVLFNDITKRMRALEALRQSEAQLRTLGDNLPNGAIYRYRVDAAGQPHVDFISAGIERITGVPAAEYMADVETVERNTAPEDFARMTAAIALSRERLERFDVEVRHPHRVTWETRWSLLRSTPTRCPDGSTVWDGIELDITERKQVEEALRESETKERARAAEVQALMDAAPAAIFVSHDAGCRSMTGNRAAHELLRRPPGLNLSKSAPESEKPVNFRAMKDGIEIPNEELPVQKAASTGQPVRNCELDIVFEDGETVNLVGDAVPLLDEDGKSRGSVGVLSNITELKRAETRLREAQKLESLGLLAGGVAHDFNNLLVGVIGNASLAQEMLPADSPAIELLEGVIKTGEQAAHLTRQMLAYSGKGRFVVEALNLSALIPEMSGLVRPSISKKIALHLDLDPELPPIEADRGQIQQVFMNLALNAAEAIGSHDGLISVRTGVQDVDEKYLRQQPAAAALRPGRYVCLEVRDTGCGMDGATKSRIFDPFFSTKFTGRGLGLAAVAGIVRGHKAAIIVESAPGKGSCFTALFPAAAAAIERRVAAARDVALQGAGVVLVVDDERIVREMVKRALERHGYTVLLADSGLEAIDVFRRHPGDIALVVLDLSMPGMSGEEALPELRKIRPQVKVVVSSGYSEAETMTLFKGQQVSGFIQKPYTSQGIAEKVKVCIG